MLILWRHDLGARCPRIENVLSRHPGSQLTVSTSTVRNIKPQICTTTEAWITKYLSRNSQDEWAQHKPKLAEDTKNSTLSLSHTKRHVFHVATEMMRWLYYQLKSPHSTLPPFSWECSLQCLAIAEGSVDLCKWQQNYPSLVFFSNKFVTQDRNHFNIFFILFFFNECPTEVCIHDQNKIQVHNYM